MIKIGEYQRLRINRELIQGYYLQCEDDYEVLLPRKYITDDMKVGDEVEVFVYCDSEDLEVATTEQPKLTLGQCAYLQVRDVNKTGAFCDWGVTKELFIPYRNQVEKLKSNQWAVVYLYLDEVSERLVGTTKIRPFLQKHADEDLRQGQEVDLLVYSRTELGYNVVVNQQYSGLVYHNEAPDGLKIGQSLKGYIKPIRDDRKIDISLFPVGHRSIEPNAQKILEKLDANQGFLPFTDKSAPDSIRQEFGISKKLFKKAIGNLYRQKLIRLEANGIRKL